MQKLLNLIKKNINKKADVNRFRVSAKRFGDGYEFIIKEESNKYLPRYISGYDIGTYIYGGKKGSRITKVTIMLEKNGYYKLTDNQTEKTLIEDFGKKIFNCAFRESLKKRFNKDKIC